MIKKALSILAFITYLLGIYYFYNNNPSDNNSPFIVCISKQLFKIDCPGCGGQRAFHELLNGHFITAAKLNFLIFIFAPLLSYAFFSLILKPFKIHLPVLDFTLKQVIIFLVIVLGFTIIRNL